MPDSSDHDTDRRGPGLMRFFCSRRGAATARAAMMLCALILPVGGTVGGWMISKVWDEFIDTKKSMNRIELYVAGAVVRGQGWEMRLGRLETDDRLIDTRLDDHERRIYRMEGRR